jgi:hypothetical protein
MKRVAVAGFFLVANIAGPAVAADCSALGGAMTGAQIQALLAPGTGVYACYNNGSKRENNETLLSGTTTGTVQEYHTGGTTVENEGSYTISVTSPGVITYTYTSGAGPYAYNICVNPVSGTTYQFVNASNANGYNIVISNGPGTC